MKNFIKQLPSISLYWAVLEGHFHEMLQDYTVERNPDEIEREWFTAIRDALRNAWEKQRTLISLSDAWAIRALVKAEGPIRRKINELEKLINPKKEVA